FAFWITDSGSLYSCACGCELTADLVWTANVEAAQVSERNPANKTTAAAEAALPAAFGGVVVLVCGGRRKSCFSAGTITCSTRHPARTNRKAAAPFGHRRVAQASNKHPPA